MEEKIKFQVCDRWGDKAFPIDWSILPEELVENIKSEYLHNIPAYSENEGLNLKTVVYFRKVKKFKKDIKEYETDTEIFGI